MKSITNQIITMNQYKLVMLLALLTVLPAMAEAKLVEYEFDINYKTVNFSGEDVQAMSVGGSIPAPTIEATVGDTLRVTFHNKMDVESSIHWHGVLLPNDQDGVPYLTTSPILAGKSFTYEYPIIHHGTYWYHSHTQLQEQRGVYGSLVLHPKDGEKYKADREYVAVLSDWTNENPMQVLRNLKKDGDYYALKKDSVQSWLKVFQYGPEAIKNRLNSSWTRMGPMDLSDVGYDAFLLNGKKESVLDGLKGGETVRLRIVNASASSYQYVEFAGGPMTIVAADGVDTEPKEVDRLKISVAETYDVLVQLPDDNMAYEFRASAEDGTGYSSLWLGEGHKMVARTIEKPNLFLIDHSMHDMDMGDMSMDSGDHSNMGHTMSAGNTDIRMMNEYDGLRSPVKTTLPADNPDREVLLELTGNMERYVWSFNNKTLVEEDKILIRKGENVRFKFVNRTMMHHPLHLHGHFFRVLNGQGEYSPLKHTVNVPPMQTVEIEFYANEEKDWFFHCHNLYHMKGGMARVVSYEDAPGSGELNDQFYKNLKQDPWYSSVDTVTYSNFIGNETRFSNTRNAIEIGVDYDYKDEYEVDVAYERSINRFLDVFVGGDFQGDDLQNKNLGVVGIHYVLPMLIDSELRLDSKGNARLELSSDLQLTNRIKFDWLANTDDEYRLGLEYEITKKVSLVANIDSEYDGGVGIKVKL
ncbi:multicopper oxidase domain-containing protein [Gammaproteobacteria bacterium]|nr:multicopper oxidase domain-containing protein [Gammaproteobacteria bacterium]